MQPLTDQQQQAIILISSGKRMGEVAEIIGIRRETLWRWRQIPEFRQAHQERQQLLRCEMSEQVAEVMRLALAVLERDLAQSDGKGWHNSLNTAFSVLKLMQPSQLLAAPLVAETAALSPE